MKFANLLTEFDDMMVFQSSRQAFQDAGRIIKNHPGIGFTLFVAININPVIF